jgi:cbb3-type cytochrome c oxidase subunit III
MSEFRYTKDVKYKYSDGTTRKGTEVDGAAVVMALLALAIAVAALRVGLLISPVLLLLWLVFRGFNKLDEDNSLSFITKSIYRVFSLASSLLYLLIVFIQVTSNITAKQSYFDFMLHNKELYIVNGASLIFSLLILIVYKLHLKKRLLISSITFGSITLALIYIPINLRQYISKDIYEFFQYSLDLFTNIFTQLPAGITALFMIISSAISGNPLVAYSEDGVYNENIAKIIKKSQVSKSNISATDGKSVFLAECRRCHGENADGLNGKAANLHQRLEEKVVKYVIKHGSNNHLLRMEIAMPDRNGLYNYNTGVLITDAEIDAVSKYVANGLKKDKSKGASVFNGTCAMCHGEDGQGMEMVAPNIKEFTPKLLINILNHGKKGAIGTMPSFEKLTPQQKEAVSSYIINLNK